MDLSVDGKCREWQKSLHNHCSNWISWILDILLAARKISLPYLHLPLPHFHNT